MSESTMKAVVVSEPGGPEVLEVREVPRPELRPGEVRVRVATSGVNRADLLQRRGAYPVPPGWPTDILGLEFSGEIEAVGPGVIDSAPGDRVMGLVGGGGYAEFVRVPERQLLPVPTHLDLRQAGALPEAFLTAFDAMILQAGLAAGETVLIHAIGSGVGTAALQLARATGARTLGTSRTPAKLDAALHLGLDTPIDASSGSWTESVLEATGGRGADVIVDLVGGPYLGGNVACVASRGRIITVGVPGGRTGELDLRALMGRRASITGTVLRARPDEEKATLIQMARRRLSPQFEAGLLKPVLERTFTPSEAPEAHRTIEANRNFGKLLIDWTGA
jgi:putative PIG3 family NAD(P)H quinone oxidoreductase